MKISIIIPLYNKAFYVTKALDSVAAQTCTDYECIIVNDGSTDDSCKIVESWLQQHNHYTLHFTLYTIANSGVAVARNFGVAQSSGDFICFLDADDWWEPSFLSELMTFAARTPNAGLWACNYIYHKPGKTRVGVTNLVYTEEPYINYPRSYYQGTGMPVTSITIMMRRHVFDACGGFPEGIRLGEDFLLWTKIAQQYSIAFLDKPLSYYNNDIPASLRATRNLHAPAYHMLWHLDSLQTDDADWKRLFDKLRVSGLLDYWLDERYHAMAAAELVKVDWRHLPAAARKPYLQPIWYLRMKRQLLHWGSVAKQMLHRATARAL